MDTTELRQEANRLSRLAKSCDDPRLRTELEALAREHTDKALEAERRRDYLPTLGRFASWIGVFAAVLAGGSLALAQWYKPQPREISYAVAVQPHARTTAPARGHRTAATEHDRLVSRLQSIPLDR